MPAAARESCIMPASCSEPKYMIRKDTTPRVRKAARDRRNTLCTWFCRPRALASDTILDTATGRPAVEIVSSTE